MTAPELTTCGICGRRLHEIMVGGRSQTVCPIHSTRRTAHLDIPLARVLLERAQDGYVNPTGGKTTGRERKRDG